MTGCSTRVPLKSTSVTHDHLNELLFCCTEVRGKMMRYYSSLSLELKPTSINTVISIGRMQYDYKQTNKLCPQSPTQWHRSLSSHSFSGCVLVLMNVAVSIQHIWAGMDCCRVIGTFAAPRFNRSSKTHNT